MEYDVLGPIFTKALELENKLAESKPKPFRAPITCFRKVIAFSTYTIPLVDRMLPEDAIVASFHSYS
ncbi:hypothetical protein ACJMK2_001077 [Sinanodonta woodiana]|uniref:Uncharacterized protein n=1 Tax=Sinanodonta woodiana TaxID=1069815 RepID=A0ABD3XR41_SINWO